MTVTQEMVREELCKLGKTPDEIAETLKSLGIKGFRQESDSCPLANHLQKKFDNYLYVDNLYVRMSAWDEHLSLPDATRKFVSNFDNGHYPELEQYIPDDEDEDDDNNDLPW